MYIIIFKTIKIKYTKSLQYGVKPPHKDGVKLTIVGIDLDVAMKDMKHAMYFCPAKCL